MTTIIIMAGIFMVLVINSEVKRNQTITERTVRLGVNRVALPLLLLMAGNVTGHAQSDCFTYEDDEKTIINGLSYKGGGATELTIPKAVTTVRSGAFAYASTSLTSLTIEDDGNPVFESGLFGTEKTNTLTQIDMGSGMTVANMMALLKSLDTFCSGTAIVASGFSGDKDTSETTWSDVTWDNIASVTMPAELIADQDFGSAEVYGRFTIDKEIVSFCTSATFMDTDKGSNMLFYVADYREDDGRLHIQRVKYVAAGRGVLIHRLDNSSGFADLKRTGDLNDNNTQAQTDRKLYESNMLKGVTEATKIEATDGKSTNYVLKDGAFHPTSGGNIRANRAYLQIPTAAARGVSLTISFDNEETGIRPTHSPSLDGGQWYGLSGQRLDGQPTTKGLYIKNGKKHILR